MGSLGQGLSALGSRHVLRALHCTGTHAPHKNHELRRTFKLTLGFRVYGSSFRLFHGGKRCAAHVKLLQPEAMKGRRPRDGLKALAATTLGSTCLIFLGFLAGV